MSCSGTQRSTAARSPSPPHGGTVTLRGTVGSFRERREAKKAAERIYGVTEVKDDLQVRLMTDAKRADADLRGDVLKAFSLDAFVPSTVDVTVDDGHVTLTGTAEWQYQREEAEFVAANILGVADDHGRDRADGAAAERR